MDNTSVLYNAIQRTYRGAIVGMIRERLSQKYGADAIGEARKPFGKKDPDTGLTQWDGIKHAANQRRSGGTGELSTPIRDDFELLGVEHFYSVFELHFDVLCPSHSQKIKQDKAQAKKALLEWMKQIKNVRDPISHPVSDDINYDDATQVLYCARKALDFCQLPEASAQILRQQKTLLGGYYTKDEKLLVDMPPADEVVMDFVGRHRELASLNDWLMNGNSQRWALSGEGGKGKSAIAYAFGQGVAHRDDQGLDAVFWLSAKRRRFVEGTTVLVDRPDFHDRPSAVEAILAFFGESSEGNALETRLLKCLSDFPSLLIVDDIDTIEADAEDAIQFLVMTIPERTKSKVLLTSRRALFGMGSTTTQIAGLEGQDADEFLKSRSVLMGLDANKVLQSRSQILEVTDSSPLFIEDLLRLAQTGIGIEKATGLWAEKRGTEARKYAIQREYDKLSEESKLVLLALSLQGPCRHEDLCRGLDWSDDKLIDAMQQLRKMFLMPQGKSESGGTILALNRNTQSLVREVFSGTEAFRRTERLMKAASQKLRTNRSEDSKVAASVRRVGLLVQQDRYEEAEADAMDAVKAFPGRPDLLSCLAWVQRKRGDFASARMNFRRAHEFGSKQRDHYWHWSEMESANGEWGASAEAAELGIGRFGPSQGLLFRWGYALHRLGKELTLEGEDAADTCKKAQSILEDARSRNDEEGRNYSLKNQIYRAIALNLECLGDEPAIARHFALWLRECPDDPYYNSEYERLRQRFPRYLRAHMDS